MPRKSSDRRTNDRRIATSHRSGQIPHLARLTVAGAAALGAAAFLETRVILMDDETNSPNMTNGFHLVVEALKLNGLDTIDGVAGIPPVQVSTTLAGFPDRSAGEIKAATRK
jgi:hypothetical protein